MMASSGRPRVSESKIDAELTPWPRSSLRRRAFSSRQMAQRAATNDTIQAFIKTKQPLDGGRIGRPEDLDAAVVYLLSDQSLFVTGQVLAVDGGWSVSEGQHPPASSEG